jgi:hypothetical protein
MDLTPSEQDARTFVAPARRRISDRPAGAEARPSDRRAPAAHSRLTVDDELAALARPTSARRLVRPAATAFATSNAARPGAPRPFGPPLGRWIAARDRPGARELMPWPTSPMAQELARSGRGHQPLAIDDPGDATRRARARLPRRLASALRRRMARSNATDIAPPPVEPARPASGPPPELQAADLEVDTLDEADARVLVEEAWLQIQRLPLRRRART